MKNLPDKRIIRFIKTHHVLTLATSSNNIPYCANCFYVYLEEENCFAFTSDKNTRHIQEILKNPAVSGSIVLETKMIGKIQGIQFTGIIQEPKDDFAKITSKAYFKRFPYAILKETYFWILYPDFIKMTDNKLGFGKKLIWKNEEKTD